MELNNYTFPLVSVTGREEHDVKYADRPGWIRHPADPVRVHASRHFAADDVHVSGVAISAPHRLVGFYVICMIMSVRYRT